MLAGWLAGLLGWLAGCLAAWLAGCRLGLLVGWLAGFPALAFSLQCHSSAYFLAEITLIFERCGFAALKLQKIGGIETKTTLRTRQRLRSSGPPQALCGDGPHQFVSLSKNLRKFRKYRLMAIYCGAFFLA